METSNVFPLSIVDQVDAPYALSSSAQLKLVGGNYGNLAFRHGAARAIGGQLVPWSASVDKTLPLVVTAANWLDSKSAPLNDDLLAAVRQSRKVAVFGLGAQAPKGMDISAFIARMEPDSIARLRELCSRVAQIGVRDQFTRDILATLGIDNAEVLGCVSNFIDPDPALGSRILARCDLPSGTARIAITEHTLNTRSRTQSKKTLLKTMDLIEALDASYVLQGRHQIPLFRRESDELHPSIAELLDGESSVRLRRLIGSKARCFTRVPDWLEFYVSRDLVVGSRVHGAILACQAGVPSVLVTHDSRTAGLADVLGLPHVDEESFMDWDGDPSAMVDIVRAGANRYNETRKVLAESWIRFLSRQGFAAGDTLKRIVAHSASNDLESTAREAT